MSKPRMISIKQVLWIEDMHYLDELSVEQRVFRASFNSNDENEL